MLEIKAFQARCGDCILITYRDSDTSKANHIIVDVGYSQTYHRTLAKAIRQIQKDGSNIELLVLTHTDSDHIGGMKPLLKEFGSQVANRYWMNHSPIEMELADSGEISVAQAVTLRDSLAADQKLHNQPILAGQYHQIGPFDLEILSPDEGQFDKLLSRWQEQEEKKVRKVQNVASVDIDFSESIESLARQPFNADDSWSNRSSIAFLLGTGEFKWLFTGDAHADLITDSLKKLGYTTEAPVKLDLLKVSHHGSKRNTDNSFLDIIDCRSYLISTNAANRHQFPHKEAMSRIVLSTHKRQPDDAIHFYFTYEHPTLRSIFSPDETEKYKIRCHYPQDGSNHITIAYQQI